MEKSKRWTLSRFKTFSLRFFLLLTLAQCAFLGFFGKRAFRQVVGISRLNELQKEGKASDYLYDFQIEQNSVDAQPPSWVSNSLGREWLSNIVRVNDIVAEETAVLARFPYLDRVNIWKPTGKDLTPIESCRHLASVDIWMADGDCDLTPLEGLRRLKTLRFMFCTLDDNVVNALRKKLPKCEISVTGRGDPPSFLIPEIFRE